MAYLKEINTKCAWSGCSKRAVVKLFNKENYHISDYCRSHGKVKKEGYDRNEY